MNKKKTSLFLSIFLGIIVLNLMLPSILISPTTSNNEEIIPKTSASTNVTQEWVKGFSNEIAGIRISANGSKIALLNDTYLEVYSKANNNILWSFNSGEWLWDTLDMSDNGRYIVLGAGNRTYLFDSWGAIPEQPVWVHENNGSVNAVKISPDGTRICVGTGGVNKSALLFGNSNNVTRWQFYHGEVIFQKRMALSETGEYIAFGFASNTSLLLFNDSISAAKKPIWQYNSPGNAGHQVCISGDGQYITYCVEGNPNWGALYLFNRSLTFPKMPEWIYNTTYELQSTAMSRDGNFIATDHNRDWNTENNTLHFFNRTSNITLWDYNSSDPDYTFDHLAFSENGTYLAAGTWAPPSLYLFDKNTSANKEYLWHGMGKISSMDMSLDAKYIVAARTGATYNITLYSIDGIVDNGGNGNGNGDGPGDEPPEFPLVPVIILVVIGGALVGIIIYVGLNPEKMKSLAKKIR